MLGFLSGYRVIIAFVFVVVLGICVWGFSSYRVRGIKGERDDALASVASYEKAIGILIEDASVKVSVLEDLRASEVESARKFEKVSLEIEGVGYEQDGIVAPVLFDTIKRLYGESGEQD